MPVVKLYAARLSIFFFKSHILPVLIFAIILSRFGTPETAATVVADAPLLQVFHNTLFAVFFFLLSFYVTTETSITFARHKRHTAARIHRRRECMCANVERMTLFVCVFPCTGGAAGLLLPLPYAVAISECSNTQSIAIHGLSLAV